MNALVLAAILTQAAYYTPEEAKAVFTQATEAHGRGDYAAAEEGYRKLLDHGHGGATVLYNLGTAALAAGKLGEATLYLERAHRLAPSSEDIDANLTIARGRQLDQVLGQGGAPFLDRLVDATPIRPVTWVFLATWTLGFAVLITRRFLQGTPRQTAAWLSALLLLASLPTGLIVTAHTLVRHTVREAVVLSPTLAAHDVPRDSGKVAFEVHAGLRVRILEEASGYVRIRLPNGLEGWALKDQVADI